MTEIKLDDNYKVYPDTACWILAYEKVGNVNPKTGKPTITSNTSYHATLVQSLSAYLDKCLEPADSIQSVINRISEAEQRIEKAVGGVK